MQYLVILVGKSVIWIHESMKVYQSFGRRNKRLWLELQSSSFNNRQFPFLSVYLSSFFDQLE